MVDRKRISGDVTKASRSVYESGFCNAGTGHDICKGAYGNPDRMTTCTCRCHRKKLITSTCPN